MAEKEDIKILFVATGPVGYFLSWGKRWDSEKEMKKDLPVELYIYAQTHNLIGYHNDTQPQISVDDLPKKWWSPFIYWHSLYSRDLDKNRDLIKQQVLQFYPRCKNVEYITCDPIIIGPDFFGPEVRIEIEQRDRDTTEIAMTFKQHHKLKFHEFIQFNTQPFDVVWFMGCCGSNSVGFTWKKYIENFRLTLKDDGFIFYSDHFRLDDEHQFGMIDLLDVAPKNKTFRNYAKSFRDLLEIVDVGVYQFK